MEQFLKILTYSSAISLSIGLLISLIIIVVKYGILTILQNIIDKLDYLFDKITDNFKGLFDFLISEVLKIFSFILDKATELSMLINVFLVYQHPPQGDAQYISFCIYLIITTIVLLKKGDVDIDKITNGIK